MVSACLHGRCRRSHHYWGLQSPLTRTTYTYLYFGKQKTQRKAKKISNCFASHTNFHHVKYFKCSRLGHTTTGPKRPCLLKRSHDLPEKKKRKTKTQPQAVTHILVARICSPAYATLATTHAKNIVFSPLIHIHIRPLCICLAKSSSGIVSRTTSLFTHIAHPTFLYQLLPYECKEFLASQRKADNPKICLMRLPASPPSSLHIISFFFNNGVR